jgi:NADPH:quinone reductase
VLVTGASGAIGAAVVQLALDGGAAEVVAVVGRPAHRDAVLQDERVRVLVDPGDGLADALAAASITPPHLAVDTVGGDGLIGALRALPPGSRVAALGYTRGTAVTLDLPNFLLADVQLRPVNGIRRSARGRELVPHLAALLAAGRLTLGLERFAFDDLDAALTRLQSGDAVGRVVITPGRR